MRAPPSYDDHVRVHVLVGVALGGDQELPRLLLDGVDAVDGGRNAGTRLEGDDVADLEVRGGGGLTDGDRAFVDLGLHAAAVDDEGREADEARADAEQQKAEDDREESNGLDLQEVLELHVPILTLEVV